MISDKFDALVPRTMAELSDFADRISKSALIPKDYLGKPGDILVAMSMGMEVGLKPLQALQSIAVINGRPSLWGDGVRGLIMASGQLASITETDPSIIETTRTARCEIMRKGIPDPFVGEFSMDNARRAGLEGKDNYRKYPVHMLTWRAFHQAARKAFPDIYKGLAAAEEILDSTLFQAPGSVDDEPPPITVMLDAPTEEKNEPAKPKHGRPPKTQDAQAPPATVVAPPSANAAPCAFCHETGHSFNECPKQNQAETVIDEGSQESIAPGGVNGSDTPSAAANGRTLNDAEQAEIMRVARLLRPKSAMGWLMGMLQKFGVQDLAELPVDKMPALMKMMDENA